MARRRGPRGFLIVLVIIALGFGIYKGLSVRAQRLRDSRFQQALTLFNEGKYSQAKELLTTLQGEFKDDKRAEKVQFMLGYCYAKLGDKNSAENMWKNLMDNEEFAPKIYMGLALLEEKDGKLAAAKEKFKKVLETQDKEVVAEALFHLGKIDYEKGELTSAREYLLKLVEERGEFPKIKEAKRLLGQVNMELIRTNYPMEGTTIYTVKAGDTLAKIAKEFNTTPEMIKECNGLKSDIIREEQELRIINGQFKIVVDLSDHTLTLYLNDRFFKEYPVGVGKGGSTPVGEYEIINKIAEPVWYSDEGVFQYGDPRNVLGTRWLGLSKPGYGIHGTWEPETVGKDASAGCIRLYNKDVEELFKFVPVGTPVVIRK